MNFELNTPRNIVLFLRRAADLGIVDELPQGDLALRNSIRRFLESEPEDIEVLKEQELILQGMDYLEEKGILEFLYDGVPQRRKRRLIKQPPNESRRN